MALESTLSQIEEITKDINALNTHEERKAFYEYASNVPNGGVIVDVGTAEGGSAFVLALASAPTVKVFTIDPQKNEKFLAKRKELDLEDRLIFINKTSAEAINDILFPIDLLFVDGVHSYEGVMNDFTVFGGLVTDGIVMFHDYYLYNNTIGKAVDDLVGNKEIKKIKIVDSNYSPEVRTGLFIAKKYG